MRVRVKICGITRLEDALAAVEAGADAVGFVFHRPSPRYIAPEKAAEIATRLPAFITSVGVFVDLEAAQIRQIAASVGLGAVQLSGSETPEYCRSLELRWIKALRIGAQTDLDQISLYGPEAAILLDSHVEGVHGGTGKTFNWHWAAKSQEEHGRIILAGGLGPHNVAEAIAQVRPYAVDASSLLETAPGIKDNEKIAAFVKAIKSCE
ncbi:MAG: phosphoribosylanthranilate isomerase [Gemmatimonadota bacterium]|nr:phosphoribosylanthranilate isomerase [Gemmatimonadota bacterium]